LQTGGPFIDTLDELRATLVAALEQNDDEEPSETA
jgi:hypothetical protein